MYDAGVDNIRKIIRTIILVLFVGIIIVVVYFGTKFFTNNGDSESDMKPEEQKDIPDKDVQPNIAEIYGTYFVKNDKQTTLSLSTDGHYILNINKCDGYLSIAGTYEIRDKKIVLNNKEYVSTIENVNGNEELYFSIIDEHTIKQDEDLACIYQNTLFEK